nr:hypothetical protein [uncultured Carboxylicivirga sp.]
MKTNLTNLPFYTADSDENKDQSEYPFDFTYELGTGGKASGKVIFNEREITFEVTNSGNPLFELLKGMAKLIFEPSHIWGEDNISWVDWYDETGFLRWVIGTEDGINVTIKLIQYEDLFDESTGTLVGEGSMNMPDFYYAIIHKLDKFIKRLGLLNYEQKWQKDEFPLTYFLLLKKYLIEKGCWIPTNEKVGSLNDELDFLLA